MGRVLSELFLSALSEIRSLREQLKDQKNLDTSFSTNVEEYADVLAVAIVEEISEVQSALNIIQLGETFSPRKKYTYPSMIFHYH